MREEFHNTFLKIVLEVLRLSGETPHMPKPNPAPIPDLEAKKMMIDCGLTLRVVAQRAKTPYTKASEVLNGRRVCAETLRRLRGVIEKEAARA